MTLKYGRQKITTDDVISAIKTRELELNSQKRDQASGEGLFSKGKNKTTQKNTRIKKINQSLNAHFATRRDILDKIVSF